MIKLNLLPLYTFFLFASVKITKKNIGYKINNINVLKTTFPKLRFCGFFAKIFSKWLIYLDEETGGVGDGLGGLQDHLVKVHVLAHRLQTGIKCLIY